MQQLGDALLPMPINQTTVNKFFDENLSEQDVATFLANKSVSIDPIITAADAVVSQVGTELYEALFRGYTRKQWGLDPSELDSSVTARLPMRTNDDDRYFTDKFQMMPLDGYTAMFDRLLSHPNITLRLGTTWQDIRDDIDFDHLVYTGPIDEFFDYRFGKLPYRSLIFRHETKKYARHQQVGVVNYPSEAVPYTRITEFKHLTGQDHPSTSLCYEFPSSTGDPYYPVPRAENAVLYSRYQELADGMPHVTFAGRLATYRYYNMDQVVGQALAAYAKLAPRLGMPNTARAAGVIYPMPPIFQSFLQGGFEGSTHRRLDGHRLDIIAASGHDKLAMIDYALASDAGLSTIRDTLRWQLIEQTPGQYDWSTVQPIMAAARACKTQIVWDLCHFGIPQWLDIWSTDFIERFAAYAAAAAAHLSSSTDTISGLLSNQ